MDGLYLPPKPAIIIPRPKELIPPSLAMLMVNQLAGFGAFAQAAAGIVVTDIDTTESAAGATAVLTVPAGGVPSGALICIATNEFSGTAGGTVADTAGNTYNLVSSMPLNNDVGTNGFGRFFYALNVTALSSGNSITYTKQVSGNQAVISGFYATGIAAASALDAAVTQTAFGSSTSPSVTSGTPGVAGELFVAALFSRGGGAYTQDSDFVTPFTAVVTGSTQINGGYAVNAGSGTMQFAPTMANNVAWSCGVWGFKAA